MIRGTRRTASLVRALAGALLLASAARAQVPGEEIARRAFEEGVALEKKGDFAAALTKFKESEQIKATLGNRYHKAYCLEMTGKLASSLTEYEAVEKAARDANKTDLVEAARSRLEPLRPRVPQVSVKHAASPPKDAEVQLDGTALAAALLDGKSFRVDPGEHVITARAAEREPFTKRFTATEGSSAAVEIVLAPAATKPAAPPPAKTNEPAASTPASVAPSPGARSRTLPILTTAGAIVLAGAGVGAFIVAGQKQDDLEKACRASTSSTCDDDKGPTRTFDALALGSWIGAAGLTALSIVLWTSSPSAPASARLTTRGSWVGLEGGF